MVVVGYGLTAGTVAQTPTAGVTVFEGARVIVGDGRPPIDNASFVVDGARIVQVGRAADVRVPAGAARVNLAGKTVMPAIIDTHTHLSQTREALLNDLRRRAYFGIGAALSLGQDTADVAYEVRAQTLSGMARFFTAGRGITGPEPGRTTAPYWVTTATEARTAVQENAKRKVDIIKIWVDDRMGTVKTIGSIRAVSRLTERSSRTLLNPFPLRQFPVSSLQLPAGTSLIVPTGYWSLTTGN